MISVYGNFIAGEWRKGSQASANVNPSDTNDIIGEYAAGRRADVEDAAAAARQALKGWARQTEQTRADILFRVADELLDTAFGLSAGIVTRSQKPAQHFQANIESGLTMVNLPTAGLDYHVPFGGRKGSSYGPRGQGRYAAEFYTIVKTSYAQPV